jgi:hypothetical protein
MLETIRDAVAPCVWLDWFGACTITPESGLYYTRCWWSYVVFPEEAVDFWEMPVFWRE